MDIPGLNKRKTGLICTSFKASNWYLNFLIQQQCFALISQNYQPIVDRLLGKQCEVKFGWKNCGKRLNMDQNWLKIRNAAAGLPSLLKWCVWSWALHCLIWEKKSNYGKYQTNTFNSFHFLILLWEYVFYFGGIGLKCSSLHCKKLEAMLNLRLIWVKLQKWSFIHI